MLGSASKQAGTRIFKLTAKDFEVATLKVEDLWRGGLVVCSPTLIPLSMWRCGGRHTRQRNRLERTMRLPLTSGCQCGAVRYEIRTQPLHPAPQSRFAQLISRACAAQSRPSVCQRGCATASANTPESRHGGSECSSPA
jgi:hypothetical protein